MNPFLTIDDLALAGKTVLLRADLNVPMKDGRVTDATRLVRLLPTLRDLAKGGAKIVILSHFGRPDGQRNEKYSLRPVAQALAELAEKPVAFAPDCCGETARAAVAQLAAGQILVLENTRFYPGEEANDPALAKELASLGDLFVNDAFSAAHRAHASTAGLAAFLPAAAGRLMQEELEALGKALDHPAKPVAALVGGSKISTKLELLRNLIAKVDVLVLGGGMANTFLVARGVAVGRSLYEPDMLETACAIASDAAGRGCDIVLPLDVVVAPEMKAGVPVQTVPVEAVPADQMIFDLGAASVALVVRKLSACRTVIWNGPLGVFEIPPFDQATTAIAAEVARLTQTGALLSVAGGGDTVAALSHAAVSHPGVTEAFSYISTAGGAFLEWMEGKTLPGVAALARKG